MSSILLIIVALGLVTLMFFKNSSKKRKSLSKTKISAKREKRYTTASNFHSVSIENDASCCEAVDAVRGKRFLSKEAPKIPMQNCTQAQCQCHYQHFDDRRQASHDRRVDFGLTKDLYGVFGEQNRRQLTRGRRASDH